MKITNKLSIAALVLTGAFATGCSQQQVAGDSGASQSSGSQQVSDGGSQVSGGSQQSSGSQQVEGGSQQAGSQQSGSQQAGSQQQVDTPPPAEDPAPSDPVAPPPADPVAPPQPANPWAHYHPEAPACAKTKRHSHKYAKMGAPHRHNYGCQPRRYVTPPKPPTVDVFALQRKLKAKGYYKGPIDGVVGAGTRAALKRFMQR